MDKDKQTNNSANYSAASEASNAYPTQMTSNNADSTMRPPYHQSAAPHAPSPTVVTQSSSSQLTQKPEVQNDDDSDSDIEIVSVQPTQNAQYAAGRPRAAGSEASSTQHAQQYNAANATTSATNSYQQQQQQTQQSRPQLQTQKRPAPTQQPQAYVPYACAPPPDFVCTWDQLWPKVVAANPAPIVRTTNQVRAYRLTLLSNTEFTITAVLHHSNTMDFQPSLMGLRKPIKEITRLHSNEDEKAVLEEGRWRIPLSVYNQFLGYLFRQSRTAVDEIPRAQLNIASMGRAVKERGHPSPEELIDRGIPIGLANALAPYQRGGVDFVLQRDGKALIADEMGLGKTVQGIAAMACYSNEWPVLVLSPSTARYHWEAEFLNWLGADSDINCTKPPAQDDELSDIGLDDLDNLDSLVDVSCWGEEKKAEVREDVNGKRRLSEGSIPNAKKMRSPTMKLLDPSEVNVLTTSSDTILNPNTRVVIVSYGLITNLTKKNVLIPNQFKCIIVDESHMLKNKKSKRTKCVMPLLKGASRVIMLSGTPAMSKPEELFPQLNALGETSGWWNDENDFKAKYVKDKYSDPSFAELHTLLTSTVMIRRLKHDILKDMPSKLRENVHINVRDPILGQTIKDGLLTLRQGKGVLGKLSVLHQNLDSIENREQPQCSGDAASRSSDIAAPHVQQSVTEGDGETKSRKAILNQIFRLSGTAKIPALIDMLKRWLDNPTNGKLCIFAHHINVLNALVDLGGLSNAPGSTTKYIRIDGSTNPKFRQVQITSFQNDPTVKIAVLGLTAAGVGVTLTAASTIWFAELFWTPALMIQAEDRCHRIGQQAQVKVLYTIAKGTLDEVLWILLKRKFRTLGEFVEGQEMMDIVLHKTYANEFDAVDRKCDQDIDSDSDEVEKKEGVDALADEDSIQHEIEELATEDLKKAAAGNDDEDDDDVPLEKKQNSTGNSAAQAEIICLSDDDEDEPPPKNPTENMTSEEILKFYGDSGQTTILMIPKTLKLSNAKFFCMFFPGPAYGVTFYEYAGRCIVVKASDKLPTGNHFKLGDVLVAVNQWFLKEGTAFQEVLTYLRQAMVDSRPVRLIFCRDKFTNLLVDKIWQNHREARNKQTNAPPPAKEKDNYAGEEPPANDGKVIVLDD